MIGVIADPADADVVREFFELFKTPWEFYRSDRQYDVLLCAGDGQIDEGAKLVLCYAGKRILVRRTTENPNRTLSRWRFGALVPARPAAHLRRHPHFS